MKLFSPIVIFGVVVLLMLVGCSPKQQLVYCSFEYRQTVWVSEKVEVQWWNAKIKPIGPWHQALVWDVFTERNTCWYKVQFDDQRVHPNRVSVREDRVIGTKPDSNN